MVVEMQEKEEGEEEGGGKGNSRVKASRKQVKLHLKEHGWQLVRQKKHYIFKRTIQGGGTQMFTQSKTPSDRRTSLNEMAILRNQDGSV